ncbi:MAG: flagellar protein FlaG [Bacillota bacterium]
MSVEKVAMQSTLHNIDITKQNDRRDITDNTHEEQKISKRHETKEELEKVINSINEFLQPSNTHIKFELHEKLNEYYVKVVDNHTQEVVREIPSKKWLDIYASMTEFLGLIIDKKI